MPTEWLFPLADLGGEIHWVATTGQGDGGTRKEIRESRSRSDPAVEGAQDSCHQRRLLRAGKPKIPTGRRVWHFVISKNHNFLLLQDMDLRTEKEKQRSVLIKLKEISSVDESFSSVCQQNIQKLGFTLPTASRLTSSVPRRALASTSGAAAVTTANSSGATNLFRTSTVKTSAEDGAAIYADLNQVPKTTIAAAATSQKQAVA